MNAATLHTASASAAAAATAPAGTVHGKAPSPNDKLRRSTEEFEAVLLRQILTAAQKPMLSKPLLEKSQSAEIVRDLRTDRMADAISRTGSVGLARYLESHLRKNLSHQDAESVRSSLQS